jgi:hypothetical protein
MTKSISTEISVSVLEFSPEKAPVSFEITVFNDSPEFASFQVALVAAGADPTQQNWYRLFPAVSAKIPPGDRTQFQVQLLAVPPVPGGFTGTMNLTVRVYSTELRDEDRQDLRLIITGEGLLAPKITLPKQSFKAHPQEELEIPARVYNPNRKTLEVVLELVGLNPTWLPEGTQKTVSLVPSEETSVVFRCQLPAPIHAPQGLHSFSLQVQAAEVTAPPQQLLLEILPTGYVEFQCDPFERWIPEKAGRWLNRGRGRTTYDLTFHNQSNVELVGQVTVIDEEEVRQQRRQLRLPQRRPQPSPEPEPADAETAVPLPPGLSLVPAQAVTPPGAATTLSLEVNKPLPWWGWTRLKRLQVQADLVDSDLDLRNDQQTLELRTLPLIPFWIQLLGGLAGIVLLGVVWWILSARGHTQPVNSVQFNGIGTEVVSGSNDQTLRHWQVTRRRLKPDRVLERSDKAVRVVKYRPVNNDWVAMGLENGTIQLQSLLSGDTSTLERDRDDRVFDLEFDQDARALWSAHGSGLVLKWALPADPGLASQRQPVQTVEADFAVSAIALVGNNDTLLAVGGRNQQLALVDLEAETAYPIPYRNGSQTDFINSLETAAEQPNLMAAADSEGYVSLWNWADCLTSPSQCEPVDEWLAHGGAAVRSVAFSPDGCYLVSAGEDGQVLLWFLTGAGERRPDRLEGRRLRQSALPINGVDVQQVADRLLVASGGDDSQVRLNRVRLRADQCRAGQ